MSTMRFIIEIDRKAVSNEEWREDDRWDELMDKAHELFPDHVVLGYGELISDDR